VENGEKTVSEKLHDMFNDLTRAERQLANSLLENYPVSGLHVITTVARNANVSTPTVARLVQKLGFSGFPQFQAALRDELQQQISNPIIKHDTWSAKAPGTHILNSFADAVVQNLQQTLARVDPAEFDALCALLADTGRGIYLVGGRFSRTLADYLYRHLQVSREKVINLRGDIDTWPHKMLDIGEGDVLVVFDIRRYETALKRIATIAHSKGAEIVLFTDQWGSPVSQLARHRLHCRIEVPSAWDSSAVTMVLVETVVAGVQNLIWDKTESRMHELEKLFESTRTFRKFT